MSETLQPVPRPPRRKKAASGDPASPVEFGERPSDDMIDRARLPMNDLGAARRLALFAPGDLLWSPERGWLAWDGARYAARDGEAAAWRKVAALHDSVARSEVDAYRYVLLQAGVVPGPALDGRVNAYRSFAKSLGNAGKVEAVLKTHARAEGVYAPLETLDPSEAFACANGTVRLRRDAGPEGGVSFEPGWRRSDRITLAARAAFRPEATAPSFEAFLARVQPDPAMRDYLQRVIGYTLFLGNSEQKFFVFQGKGGDGKSTFLNAISYALGDLVGDAQVHSFLATDQRKGSEASPDIAALAGAKRLVKVSEPPLGATLDEGAIKQFTGGEAITARGLFKDLFSFPFQAGIVLSCNTTPKTKGDDKGIARRLRIIQWPVSIPESQQDRGLAARLEAEADGILQWCLAGVRAYLARGLAEPVAVRAAAEAHRSTHNPWSVWFETCVAPADPSAYVLTRELKESLAIWLAQGATEEELKVVSKTVTDRALSAFLDNLQVPSGRQNGTGVMLRRGVRLLSPEERLARAQERERERERAAAEEAVIASGLARDEPGAEG